MLFGHMYGRMDGHWFSEKVEGRWCHHALITQLEVGIIGLPGGGLMATLTPLGTLACIPDHNSQAGFYLGLKFRGGGA